MNFKKNDIVQVLSGDDAGSTGRVLRVLPEENKVVVEGINRVYKHLKPNRRNAQGGRLSKEMPVAASNVLPYCSTCRHGVRVGHRYADDGHKERFCRKCKNTLRTLSKPRKTYSRQK